jgi:hypothetical protein
MWWATLKTMVWKTPLKSTPTPCKNSKNQHQKDKGHNPWMDCAFGCLKMGEKNKKWWKVGFVREWGRNGQFEDERRVGGGDTTARWWCNGAMEVLWW